MTGVPYDITLSIFKLLTKQHRNIIDHKSAWDGVPGPSWDRWWRLLVAADNAEKELRKGGFVGCVYGMLEECPGDAPIICGHCSGKPFEMMTTSSPAYKMH